MRWLFVFLVLVPLLGGCANGGGAVRSSSDANDPDKPQYHNRLRMSETSDLFGV